MSSDTQDPNRMFNGSNDIGSNEHPSAQNSLELTRKAIAEEHVLCKNNRFRQQKQHMINNYLYSSNPQHNTNFQKPIRNGEAYTFHNSQS